MTRVRRKIQVVTLGLAASIAAHAQTAPSSASTPSTPPPSLSVVAVPNQAVLPPAPNPMQPLLDFRDSDIKFNLGELMSNLRDSRHEGWVLAAYPDPKTSRPLIGAGFSLDVPEREHPQTDPFNPNLFLEPSSAQLWQAAGLDPARLQTILDQFDDDLAAWKKRNFQRKARTQTLTPQLTEEEATQLLRISAIQAVHNAHAYCRGFDNMTGYQQMALSQLVFQMGVNLEEFTHFLSAINSDPAYRDAALAPSETETDAQHWKNVQSMLIQSDWARRYSTRAVAVIAMFDADYENNPAAAERRVRAQVHPYHSHR
ncbi:MAG: hypothetical protein WCC25_22980, partial [Candidatus Korobacteraceae bacterium]